MLIVDGLNYNLLSITQLCDKGNQASLTKTSVRENVTNLIRLLILLLHVTINYSMFTNNVDKSSLKCLKALTNDPRLWRRRLGHLNMHTIKLFASHDLVRGLHNLSYNMDELCKLCAKGKHNKVSFKPKKVLSTSRLIELLHIDLCGPMCIRSPKGKQYILVVVDDFSRFHG